MKTQCSGLAGPDSGLGFGILAGLTRHAACLVMGIAAALGLFLLMQGMISQGEIEQLNHSRITLPEFIRMDPPLVPVRQRQRKALEPPEKMAPLPRSEAVNTPQPPAPRTPAININLPDIRPNLALAGLPSSPSPAPVPADRYAPAAGDGLIHYTQSLTPVSQIPPRYPRQARRAGISGWVRLEFVVNPDGSVSDISVVEAEPRRGIFDQESIRAIRRWQFHPQIREGKPVPALATFVIRFNLEE